MVKMTKSIEYCIEHNDYEEAYKRFKATNDRWKNEWFKAFLIIAENAEEVKSKYKIDLAERTITKNKSVYSYDISAIENCDLLDEATEKCYLFEFFNENDELICSKVGTTTRKVTQRLKEELRSKTYSDMGATKAVIHRVYDCYGYPAEGLESFFRANYIKKYPDSFKKNDRFIKVAFDFAEADKIYSAYLATDKNF